jgi:hypothetical protein
MNQIIETVTDWPIIVQGALGSGFFWLLLTLGQKATQAIFKKLSSEKSTANSFGKSARDFFHEGHFTLSQMCFHISIYGAIHYLIKAFLVIYVASLVGSFIWAFGIIGNLIGIYFIFRALSYVPHFGSMGDYPESKESTGHEEDEKEQS